MTTGTTLPPTVSEARLASVLDTAVFGIIVSDQAGRILVYNKACERLFGWTAEEVYGKNLTIIMPPRDATAHDRYIRNYLETGEEKIIGIGREVRGQHKDGTVFPVQLAVGEASTPEGRQFIGILRDLRSEFDAAERLAALQAQLVRMARINAVDEMGAALAHELNQPLTAVMLYLQAVARAVSKRTGPDALPKEISDILAKALSEADRAGQIIHRMRRFIEKREAMRQLSELPALLNEAIEFTVIGSKAREVEIERHVAEGLPSVEVDPVQIQQVIVNLLRNAIDAVSTSPAKKIIIGISGRDDMVELSVEDTGPGVPPDIAPQLFRAFETGSKGGIGLGLAISRSIAQSHGGDLVVDPGGKGRGARFTLILPVKPAGGAGKTD
jgi:two-component system sensor kinase FixL